MNNKTKIPVDIKKYIQKHINEGLEDIAYWNKGKNLFAESIADNIAECNEKLKNLLTANTIDADMIKELIKTETDDSLILIYEDIIDLLSSLKESERCIYTASSIDFRKINCRGVAHNAPYNGKIFRYAVYYRSIGVDFGECTCNNDYDDCGDCVYDDGILCGQPICKYYKI